MIAYFVKKDPRAILPAYKTKGSVGCDICGLEDVYLKPGETTKVHTGLIAIPPLGCYFELYVRSSLCLKFPGIVLGNSVGIIDTDFSGPNDEICVLLTNTSTKTYQIKAGERIAQLVLREFVRAEIKEKSLEELTEKSRGGFGSTDNK